MNYRSTLALSMLALLCLEAGGGAVAQSLPEGVMVLSPAEIKWRPGAAPGTEQAELLGAQDKAGPYTVRLKFPAGYKGPPHTHIRIRSNTRSFRGLGASATAERSTRRS
jgi:hypothetical protein